MGLMSGQKMRAVRFHGCRDIRVDQIEEPTCEEGQVKVCSCAEIPVPSKDPSTDVTVWKDPTCLCRNLRKRYVPASHSYCHVQVYAVVETSQADLESV